MDIDNDDEGLEKKGNERIQVTDFSEGKLYF